MYLILTGGDFFGNPPTLVALSLLCRVVDCRFPANPQWHHTPFAAERSWLYVPLETT
jgi:hypothetical protein